MTDQAAPSSWEALTAFGETFTCYSSALATWLAWSEPNWARTVNPGLWLMVTEADDGLFGFSHYPASLRLSLGLVRRASDDSSTAVAGILKEVGRSGRAIVAGDGYHLPWHVAASKRHVPHWFVLGEVSDGLAVVDPFACRNELGWQQATWHTVDPADLTGLLPAITRDDPVLVLREAFAFGDEGRPLPSGGHQWFVQDSVDGVRGLQGKAGPEAVLLLAQHFREHGQDLRSYRQADDLWSIARHRAFLARYAAAVAERNGDGDLGDWAEEHAEPLARRWAHIPPLLMQATLALGAGREASTSVADTLEELAARELAAAQSLPSELEA